ncbi:NUDIX domain-containing protein [Pleionea sp. CnH1-48]|uniref:NUDIX domain-containing protein n=1 Tax=Pleionea sp. CnH1-48 TaxID=2954494 RepID=UPI002097F581|nr:NUDIX hydrolase [Pleionea sp. CnH1-48]MCO7223049.1 NUDIX hydrolase [Pleionea sp. CnH1-48]
MEHRICVGALIVHNDKLLMVNHKREDRYDFWVAPGGGVKDTESLEDSVIREVKEETGLNVAVDQLMYIEQMYFPKERSVKFWYRCELIDGHLDCTAKEATIEYIVDVKFMDKHELELRETYPPMLKESFWEKVKQESVQPEVIGLRELKNY